MRIRVNGEDREIRAGTTLAALLAEMKVPPARVAVERNREIVRRDAYDTVVLQHADVLEIVQLVGGG